MTTSDYALIISMCSLFIALSALIWNIWQKFIFVKPALQVTFGVWRVLEDKGASTLSKSDKSFLGIGVINLGPGPVILYACIAKLKKPWWNMNSELGMLNPIHDPSNPKPISLGPFSAGLPAKIEAGEMKSFYFPYEKDSFLKERILAVGVNDTYRRNTWCRSKDVKAAYRSYRSDFNPGTA